MKKFTRLLSLLFFLQVVWSSSIYAQVYSNDFSTGIDLPSPGPGNLFSTVWASSNPMTNPSGELLSKGFSTGSGTLTLTIKVKCGYELDISSIALKHRRDISGPQNMNLIVGGTTVQSGISVIASGGPPSLTPLGSPYNTTGIPAAQDIVGQVLITLDLVNASNTGEYYLDDFVINGTVTSRFSSLPTALAATNSTVCAGTPAAFSTTGFVATAGTTLTPQYQWQFSTTDIPSATNTAYTIASATDANEGAYRVGVRFAECAVGTPTEFYSTPAITLVVNTVTAGTISADQTICSGGDPTVVTVSSDGADGTPTYSWESSSPSPTPFGASIASTASYDPPVLTANTYYHRIITSTLNTVACPATSSTMSVTVRPLPTSSISGTPSVCAGSTTTLTGTTGFTAPATSATGAWTTSDMTKATVVGGVVTGVAAGTANIIFTVTDSNGCSSSSSVTVTVNPLPIPTITGVTPVVCVGSTIAPTYTNGVVSPSTFVSQTWTSSTVGVATVSTTSGVVTGVSSGTSVITYTVTDNQGCSSSTTTTVTVNPLPTISFSNNGVPAGQVCIGNTITINGNANGLGLTHAWTVTGSSVTPTSGTGSTITLTGTSAGTVTVVYTVTSGASCSTSSSMVVTVNGLPANPTITGSLSICEGSTTVLTGSTPTGSVGPYFTDWTGSGPANVTPTYGITTASIVSNVPAVTPSAGYLVGYSVSDGNGCINAVPASATVTVFAKPSVASIPAGNQTLCNTSTFTVTGNTPSVGSGTWTVTGGVATSSTSPTTTITGVTAGTTATAVWTITNGTCGATSSNVASVTLTNNVAPTITASAALPQCNNGTFAITSSASVGTGVWTTTAGTVTNTTSTSTTVTGIPVGTTQTLTWTVTNGLCVTSTTTTVTNNAPPSAAVITTTPQKQCGAGVFVVNATAPTVGTGVWTVVGGVAQTPSSNTTFVTGVAPGTVATATWTVSSGPGCPSTSASVTLTNYQAPTGVDAGPVSLSNCNNGTFNLTGIHTALTGVTDLHYSWTTTGGTASPTNTLATVISGVPAGTSATATFTVTNGVCTAASDQVVLNNYAIPTAAVTPNITVCNQTSDFTVTGTATPTTPTLGVYTYAWSITGGTLTSSSTGTSITVSVASGSSATASWTVTNGSCSTSSSMTITNNGGVTASIPAGNQTFCNTSSFSVAANNPSPGTGVWTVTGGTPSSTNSSSITVTGVTAGTTATAVWTVTNGLCIASSSVTLTNVGAPTASITTTSSIKCNEVGPFTVNAATPAFGTGVWTITGGSIVSSSGTSASVSVTAGSTATVTWTVTNGICGSTSSSITIENRPALTATIVPNPITPTEMCPGTSINLQATPNGGPGRVYASQSFVGGAGSGTNFTVNFNTNPITNPNRLATINGLAPQNPVTLTYTIIDNAGCTFSTQFVTKVNPPILVTVPATNVCVGNMATVTPVITGGSGTYSTFSWTATGNATASGSASTFVVTGVTAGSANVVYSVVDNQTCPASGTATGVITVNPSPVLVNASQTNVSCFGGSNGAVTFTGATSYTIAPTVGTQGSAGVFTGLTAGTYTVVGTSGFGCSSSTSVTITQPTQVVATVTVTTPVPCNGGMATLLIIGSGGTPGYIISGGTPTPSVVAGTYTYTVTDVKGCSASASITVGQPPVLTATISVTSNVSCNGGSDGISEVTAGGGTAPYSYLWSSGDVTRMTTSGLVAGTYTVTVTDANSCTASTTVIIGQPPVLVASITSQVNVTCNGGSTGSATAQAVGGTTTYSYSWNTLPVQTTATATGLAAGTYTVVVTDAQSCVASTTVTITQPTALLAGASQNTPPSRNGFGISCFGGSDGSATAAAFGGTMPYTYLWNNGETTVVATMLSAGLATVTITDFNGCTTTASVTMTQPPTAVSFSSTAFTSPNCAVGQGASNNGSITVTATGGIAPYAYAITPLSTQGSSGIFSGLSTGIYTITVTDANSCTATTSVTVTALAVVAVTPTAVPNPICSGTATTLSATATGGTITGYVWSVTASTGNTATAVPATASTANFSSTISQGANTTGISTLTYTVIATNSSSCSASSSVNVVVNPLPYLTGVGSPDPTCRDAGAFGFIYVTNPNSANQINFIADTDGILLNAPPSNVTITASPVRVDLVPTMTQFNHNLTYTVTNTTTGCVSPTSTYVVRVNPLPTLTAMTISGPNDLCDGGPIKTLDVTTNGAGFAQVGAFPRTVRIRKTINGVVSTFDIVVPNPGSGSVASSNIQITEAGTYEAIGITDGATCAGTVTGIPIRTLSDGRFTVTAPASNTTQVVYNGCSAVLTAAASFNSTPSVGTLAYQWEVDPGTGYIAVNGETNPTLTLTGINSTFNGKKYRLVVTSSGSSCGTVVKFSNVITLSVATLAAAAGPDQTAPAAAFTLAATLPVGATGAWSVVSTNTTVTFASTTNPVSTVTLADPNTTATLRWTVSAPGGCSTFDDVVITRVNVTLDAKVFLEGPLSGGSMTTNIRSILPTTSPYGTGESSSIILSNPVTEWIKVELRNAATPATVVDTRSGLLLSTGRIVDMDGISPITFKNAPAGTYHIAVIHRNHIDFRTNTALSFGVGTPTVIDFSIAAPNVFNTALKLIGGTTSAMYAGDANGDNRINLSDYLLWVSKNNTVSYPYSILSNSAANADFNLNPGVNLTDYLRWFSNNNINKAPNP